MNPPLYFEQFPLLPEEPVGVEVFVRVWMKGRGQLGYCFSFCSSSLGPAFSTGSAIPTPVAPLHDGHSSLVPPFPVSRTLVPSSWAAFPSSPVTSPSGPRPQLTVGESPSRKGGGGTRTRVA